MFDLDRAVPATFAWVLGLAAAAMCPHAGAADITGSIICSRNAADGFTNRECTPDPSPVFGPPGYAPGTTVRGDLASGGANPYRATTAATVDYGTLSGSTFAELTNADASLPLVDRSNFSRSVSSFGFSDTVVVTAPGVADGTPMIIEFRHDVSVDALRAAFTGDAGAASVAVVRYEFGWSTNFVLGRESDCLATVGASAASNGCSGFDGDAVDLSLGDNMLTSRITVIAGQPLQIFGTLLVRSEVEGTASTGLPARPVPFLGSGVAEASAFASTSISVLTPGGVLSSDSGHSYLATVTPVPEPATIVLLGAGLAALFARRRSVSAHAAR